MNASLSVELVPVEAQPQVDAAVETERRAVVMWPCPYTFDIKVLDPDGNELQPGEGQSVNVFHSDRGGQRKPDHGGLPCLRERRGRQSFRRSDEGGDNEATRYSYHRRLFLIYGGVYLW